MQPTTHHPVDPPPPKLGHHRPSPPIVQPDFGLQQGDTANEISGSAPTLQPAVADERAAPYVSSPVAAAAAKAATLLATAATSRSGSVPVGSHSSPLSSTTSSTPSASASLPPETGTSSGGSAAFKTEPLPAAAASPVPAAVVPDAPPCVQPAYFYPSEHTIDVDRFAGVRGKVDRWLTPDEDEHAKRGIPVFEPTMEEFADFEEYMHKIDLWGRRSGIVKVIPPKEWVDALPPITGEALTRIQITSPIQQNMMGTAGLYRQNNIERNKTRPISVEEWFKKCTKPQHASPSLKETDRSELPTPSGPFRGRKRKLANIALSSSASASGVVDPASTPGCSSSYFIDSSITTTTVTAVTADADDDVEMALANNPSPQALREAALAKILEDKPWLPADTKPEDYTPEACRELERKFWRTMGLGEPAWYGADLEGSLFTEETKLWNVAKLPNLLNRLKLKTQLPGVNTPYLYWGMWKASFCWHVEDMDLYSVNYIHFGAPKNWYAIPQSKAVQFERVMKGYFPGDENSCDQFLRHKSFAASPQRLANDSLRPNVLVQHANEFVFTYPRGYHSGFNIGFNCAESINFAIDSWVELGRRAKACDCVGDSVKIDVDAILAENELLTKINEERASRGETPVTDYDAAVAAVQAQTAAAAAVTIPVSASSSSLSLSSLNPSNSSSSSAGASGSNSARASVAPSEGGTTTKPKKRKLLASGGIDSAFPQTKSSVKRTKLDLPPPPSPHPPPPPEWPCVLCPSTDTEDLVELATVPAGVKLAAAASAKKNRSTSKTRFEAHERCAMNIPETYFIDVNRPNDQGDFTPVRLVEGVQGIPNARWALTCAACTMPARKMGAKTQCTQGKCSRAFHVTCALAHPDVVLRDIEQVEWVVEPPSEAYPSGRQIKNTTLKVECLCAIHNPVIKERKKREAAEERHRRLLTITPPEVIRIKAKNNGQMYEVVCLNVHEETESVTVAWEHGKTLDVPWQSIVLAAPTSATASVSAATRVESAASTFKSDYVYEGPQVQPRQRGVLSVGPAAATVADNDLVAQPSQDSASLPLPPLPSPATSNEPSTIPSFGRIKPARSPRTASAIPAGQQPSNLPTPAHPHLHLVSQAQCVGPPSDQLKLAQHSASGAHPNSTFHQQPGPSSAKQQLPFSHSAPLQRYPQQEQQQRLSFPSHQKQQAGASQPNQPAYPSPQQQQWQQQQSNSDLTTNRARAYPPLRPHAQAHPNPYVNQLLQAMPKLEPLKGPNGKLQMTPGMCELARRNPAIRAAFVSMGWEMGEPQGQEVQTPQMTGVMAAAPGGTGMGVQAG